MSPYYITVLKQSVITAVNYCPIYHSYHCSNMAVIYCSDYCFSKKKPFLFYITAVIYWCDYIQITVMVVYCFVLLPKYDTHEPLYVSATVNYCF